MKSQRKKVTVYLDAVKVFTLAELKRNLLVLFLPAPLWLALLIYRWYTGIQSLDLSGTWAVLIGAALFAMTYGLQCFSNETDQRTLDFILTRPLSPYLIISVKYGLSLGLLLGWSAIFTTSVPLSWHLLPLTEGMGPGWILLILLMIHSISFFSGLLAKGLERFFVITVMTGLLAAVCYYLWINCLNLLKANLYWFDILPRQLFLVKVIIPTYLAFLSLATPFIGTIWYLRSRIPLWRFKPAKWLLGFWLSFAGVVLLCLWLFAPPLWPDSTAFYGDWHERGGILLSGPLRIGDESSMHKINHQQKIACQIRLAQFGHQSRRIYSGVNIVKPHFAPDGSKFVFTEQRQLKIFNLQNRKLTLVGPGDLAAWSGDSQKLIYALQIGPHGLSRIFIYDLMTKKTTAIPETLALADLVWDSANGLLYYLGYQNEVGSFNIRTQQVRTYTSKNAREKPLNYYGIVSPTLLRVAETGTIVWGQICEDELRIFELDPKNHTIRLAENLVSPRLKNAAPLLINSNYQAFIWQRQDGSFIYQATRYASSKAAKDHHHHHGYEDQ
jgi:ABC-type transport system involved in multi-copper enzyme maturation permease subunit